MIISVQWLKNYIDISDIDIDTLCRSLIMAGLEVEEITSQDAIYKHIVIGYVEEKIKHPNANKLSLCTVFDGKERRKVVCGAPNVEAGQVIVLALPGAIIPDGKFEIKIAKIRGEESSGMICSRKELGLSDDHSGIWVLPGDTKIGISLAEYLEKTDTVLEIGITPNRPDALSHIGVARDVAALFNKELLKPQLKAAASGNEIDSHITIEIEDAVNCPRYSAKVVKDVTVGDSPKWLKRAIESIGLRSINNVVDVTNFILHETGQPLHAFDLDKISGNKIVVKQAESGSNFVTLDSKSRDLDNQCLMIRDAEKAVAIGGIMGGENSEITRDTKNILIESAYFNPSSIRRSAKKLGISSDASYRFERGVDYENTLYSAERAAELIAEVAGGKIVSGCIDIYPNPIPDKIVTLRFARVQSILGYPIDAKQITEILRNLGMSWIEAAADSVTVSIPGFRPDIEREIDLIEEIARIYGYDNIPPIQAMTLPLIPIFDETAILDVIRGFWSGIGFNEIISNSLQRTKIEEEKPKAIATLNPQSADMVDLRTSLLPGLLTTIAKNISVGEKNLRFYEIGKIFIKKNPVIASFDDFDEKHILGVAITGLAGEKQWYSKESAFNFFDLKGVIKAFLSKISLDNLSNDCYNHNGNYLFSYLFSRFVNSQLLFTGGKVRKEVLSLYNIEQDVFYAEFNIEKIEQGTPVQKKFKEPLKYPRITRDAAFVVEKEIESEAIIELVQKQNLKFCKAMHLFDLFENDSIGETKKSLAYSIEFYDETKTLTDAEVEEEFIQIIGLIKAAFAAELRG